MGARHWNSPSCIVGLEQHSGDETEHRGTVWRWCAYKSQ